MHSSNLALLRVPKTGTVSFVVSAKELFENGDNPCMSKGHTVASEYLTHGHDHDYITFVRDPLQVYCSAYYFIKNRLNREAVDEAFLAKGYGALNHHMDLIASTDLEGYLLAAPSNDFFARYYDGVDVGTMFFVGSTNEMDASIKILNALLGTDIHTKWMNKNPKRPETLQPYYVSPEIAEQFMARNALEYQAYTAGMQRFNQLKEIYL